MIKDSMFDGYAVTNDGKVYSKKTNKFIKPSIGSKGYFQVCLTVDGKNEPLKFIALSPKHLFQIRQANHKSIT